MRTAVAPIDDTETVLAQKDAAKLPMAVPTAMSHP